jgi:hypothetical protein
MDIPVESRGEAEAFFALLHCTHTGRLLLQPPQERGGAAPPGLEMWWDDDERAAGSAVRSTLTVSATCVQQFLLPGCLCFLATGAQHCAP